MVDVTALTKVTPSVWADASSDWQALAEDLGEASSQISSDVAGMISGHHWTGTAATSARARVTKVRNAFEAAQGEVYAVSDVLEGLAEAMTICQQTLAEAQDLASRNGLQIQADGSVTAVVVPPELPGASPPLGEAVSPAAAQVQELVTQALQSATEADRTAAQELSKLARDTGQTNWQEAWGYNNDPGGDGLTASRLELQMIYDSIPTGPPSLVAAWWAGLTPAEQQMLMGAAPGKLGTLNGIPASVQAQLRGDNGINRVAVVNYALNNAHNTSIDIPHKDSCTDFASYALAAGGMQQKGSPLDRTDPNAWFNDPLLNPVPPGIPNPLGISNPLSRSYSWAGAPDLHQFLTQNGSTEVPYSQAQPGDIAFYTNNSQGIYHTAVVTAVVNGQVFYTQHTPGEMNASWGARQYDPVNANPSDPTNIIIVRPGIDTS